MADNYLERKMEELRNGTSHKISRVNSNPPGTIIMKFPYKCVFVFSDDSEITPELLVRVRSSGCKVGFAGTDMARAKTIAKAKNVAFVPADNHESALELFESISGKTDLCITVADGAATLQSGTSPVDLGSDCETILLNLLSCNRRCGE